MQCLPLEKLPTFEELLYSDTPDTEWFRQMTIAQASLARHFARDDDRTICLGKEAAPEPTAEDREKRSRAGSCQMHWARVASHKTGGEGDDSQGGQDGGRGFGQIEMKATFRQRGPYSVDRRGLCSVTQKHKGGLCFRHDLGESISPVPFAPVLDLEATPCARADNPIPLFADLVFPQNRSGIVERLFGWRNPRRLVFHGRAQDRRSKQAIL